VSSITATLLEVKPGRRALIRYRSRAAPTAFEVYGKAYCDTGIALRTYDILRRLSNGVFAVTPGLCVPRPLCVVAGPVRVLYEPVPGRALDSLAGTPAMTGALGATARWLAALHGAELHLDRTLDAAHEADNAARWAAHAAGLLPGSAAGLTRLAAALAGVPEPPATAVPIHKDLHHQHVIVGDRLGVVDVDEARMGDAAFDLAHFSANLALLARRAGVSEAARRRWLDAFLGTYRDLTGWRANDSFRWFSAYTYVKLAKQLATGTGPRPRPRGTARAEQVDWVVHEGLACLER